MRRHTKNRFESACPPFAEQNKGGEDLWHAKAKEVAKGKQKVLAEKERNVNSKEDSKWRK